MYASRRATPVSPSTVHSAISESMLRLYARVVLWVGAADLEDSDGDGGNGGRSETAAPISALDSVMNCERGESGIAMIHKLINVGIIRLLFTDQ
jgi:hypothetical protein